MTFVYLWVLAALLIDLAFVGRELLRAWRGAAAREGRAILLIAAAACALGAWAARGTPLRGGYDNDHDFNMMSMDFLRGPGRAVLSDKEVSPLALFAVFDRLSGYSLYGIAAGQTALWFLSAFLLHAAARRLGFGRGASLLGAGVLFFNFLFILSTHTLSSTNANVFYFLCALCAWACFLDEPDPVRSAAYLAWFASASFLTFTARYEFVPVLAWSAGLGALFWGRERLKLLARALREKPRPAALLLASAALSALACLRWAALLSSVTSYNGPAYPRLELFLKSLPLAMIHHLGEENLERSLGLPAACLPWLAPLAAACAAAILPFLQGPARRRRLLYWLLVLGGWILYDCAAYMPLATYPLHFMRHHLYFFLPVAFLAAFAQEGIGLRGLRLPRAARIGAAALALALYAGLNLRAARDLDGEWRTNDREWRFLARVRRNWPKDCRATYPIHDSRRGVIQKYFPSVPYETASSGCRLAYRPPVYELVNAASVDSARSRQILARMPGAPYAEEAFEHRYYTIWDEEGIHGPSEIKRPVPVRVGFYRLP